MRRFTKAPRLKQTDYFRRFRIGRAREKLSLNRLPIEKVAWTVGYDDQASLRKTFAKLAGLNPKE